MTTATVMQTTHQLLLSDARHMTGIKEESIDLVVTSPPYPMIRMWDGLFSSLSFDAKEALECADGNAAFESMHRELDKVWRECYRVLKTGSFACINIGDAVRTLGGRFRLYSNHSRIIGSFLSLGFDCLPVILWRKQTNAPNKFMGSGMLPCGAYVTLEHEYILIFRKGCKKEFNHDAEKAARIKSSFFWEERNAWFSDVWDFKGISQQLDNSDLRDRSAAFPLELPYRLISMYSLYEDLVLDPFLGTGTTMLASMACGRNSIGIEIDGAFAPAVLARAASFLPFANERLSSRIAAHADFVAGYARSKGPVKYVNGPHGFPVVTKQETGLQLYRIKEIAADGTLSMRASYEPVGKIGDGPSLERQCALLRNAGSRQCTLPL